MKKLVFVLCLITVIAMGCDGGNSPSVAVAKEVAGNIVYSKDARTGLCFGSVTSKVTLGWSVVSITMVPCDKVEKFIAK